MERSIDNVTCGDLHKALKICELKLTERQCDLIIDVIELLEEKGSEASLRDICKVHETHKEHQTYQKIKYKQDEKA